MNIKKTLTMVLSLQLLAMLTVVPRLQAGETGGFSVGHDALSSSKDDPKNRDIGSITARYSFGASKQLKTYVGTGLAYSYAEKNEQAGQTGQTGQAGQHEAVPGLKTGIAGQAGINYQLGNNVSLSVDYQYLRLQPDNRGTTGNEPAQKIGVGLDIKF